jgi:hypothetical protein
MQFLDVVGEKFPGLKSACELATGDAAPEA